MTERRPGDRLPMVYVETTVLSYLAARPSRDVLIAAHQGVTIEWWRGASARFSLVTSAVVLEEADRGDPDVAAARRALLDGLPLLPVDAPAHALAGELLRAGLLPSKAGIDALHVAVASLGAADYLVTWNMRHLAGAIVRRRIEQALRARGFEPPTVCTPEELLAPPPLGGSDA